MMKGKEKGKEIEVDGDGGDAGDGDGGFEPMMMMMTRTNEAERFKKMQLSIVASASAFPGFRFSPTDDELINFYLKKKLERSDHDAVDIIPEIDFCRHEPWDLPVLSIIRSDNEWFFFSTRGKKYPNGSQSKRATQCGYWKATGKERNVKSCNNIIGTKRTLVFHKGRAPKGARTEWIMHEYCVNDTSQEALVVCRLRRNVDFRLNESSKGAADHRILSARDNSHSDPNESPNTQMDGFDHNANESPNTQMDGFDHDANESPNTQMDGFEESPNMQMDGFDHDANESPNTQMDGLDESPNMQMDGFDHDAYESPNTQMDGFDESLNIQTDGFDHDANTIKSCLKGSTSSYKSHSLEHNESGSDSARQVTQESLHGSSSQHKDGVKVDDCFADIINDDIVNLDESAPQSLTLQGILAGDLPLFVGDPKKCMQKLPQETMSSHALSGQGTAVRRIKLRQHKGQTQHTKPPRYVSRNNDANQDRKNSSSGCVVSAMTGYADRVKGLHPSHLIMVFVLLLILFVVAWKGDLDLRHPSTSLEVSKRQLKHWLRKVVDRF